MYVYMGQMRWKDIIPYESWFWEKNKITLINDHVSNLDEQQKSLHTTSGKHLTYDKLILATGSSSNRLDIPGADLDGVTSLYSIQDLEYIESKSKYLQRAVIVGGGLIGVEFAEMLHSRNIPVTFLVREASYSNAILPPEESAMINQQIKDHGIDLRLNTELKSIKGNDQGQLKSIITSNGDEIHCQFVGISVGVHPNISWLENSTIDMKKGILVDEFLQTNIADIYAIGDCAEIRKPDEGRKAIEPLWYTGRMMGEYVAQTICGLPSAYAPGIWFNSAKFFSIEYQVYGEINSILPQGQKTLFWHHSDVKKSIRINYTEDSVIGFNLMGVRFRQEVCEKWIATKTKIEIVLAGLELALFDPEFSSNYANEVREAYLKLTGISVLSERKRSYNSVYTFLKKSLRPSV